MIFEHNSFVEKDKENMGLQQESFDQTGDSRWSDMTASSVGPETARKPIQERDSNLGWAPTKRKSDNLSLLSHFLSLFRHRQKTTKINLKSDSLSLFCRFFCRFFRFFS